MTGAARWIAAATEWMTDVFEAGRLADELGCEVIPHPLLAGRVEARDPLPGVWLLSGTPEEIRAEVRRISALTGRTSEPANDDAGAAWGGPGIIGRGYFST